MYKNENKLQFTLFAKILIGFLIIILPLYLFSIQVNIWSQNNVRKELMKSSKSNMLLYFNSFENELRNVVKNQLNLINDPDFLFLASEKLEDDIISYYSSAKRAREKLQVIESSSPYVMECQLFLPAKNSVLSTQSSFKELPEEFKTIYEKTNAGIYPFYELNGNILCSVTSNFTDLEDKDDITPSYIVVVRFSKEKLKFALVNQKDVTIESKAAFISIKNGITLIDEKDEQITASLFKLVEKHNIDKQNYALETIKVGNSNFITTYAESSYLNTAFILYTPENQYMSVLNSYKSWMFILTLISLAIIVIFSIWIRRLIITPLKRLSGAYIKFESGDFNTSLEYKSNDEFKFIYIRSNEMFKRVGTLITEVYEQRLHASEAELKQLQYQINPHFLYNSILIVCNLIKMTDYDCAYKLSQHLASFYQYITRGRLDFVPLIKEVSHARDYIEIQAIRFIDRFEYELDSIPDGFDNFVVPRLILQPVIENCFKYGLKDKVEDGRLYVHMSCDDSYLHIFIEDNGDFISDDKLEELSQIVSSANFNSDSTGLCNVHRRIQIKYGNDSGLFFTRKALNGLCVEIRISIKGSDINV